MKRFLRTAREVGIAALFVRGLGRASAQRERRRRLLRERRARRRASRLPGRARAIAVERTKGALVSIAIVGGGDWRTINRCLGELQKSAEEIPAHVRLYYDPAIDSIMRMHSGVQLSPVPEKVTPARIVSDAADYEYAYAIDSRAVPEADALADLLSSFDLDSRVAIAGSKICALDGTIEEAGREISSGGAIEAIGAGDPIDDSRYDFVRDVDSVSPASFAVRLQAVRAIERGPQSSGSFADAVADLCRELRERGMRSICQPRSLVFRASGESLPKATERSGPTVLFVDEHVPFDDRDAGSRRMASLLRWAAEGGWNVLFGSRDPREYGRYADRLRQAGIEVLLGFDERSMRELAQRGAIVRCVWLSRPAIATAYLPAVRSVYPHARAIYDTVDLHFVRLMRQARVEKSAPDHKALERQELAAAAASDFTVVTTPQEADALRERGIDKVGVVALSETRSGGVPVYAGRAGILFTGNYSHAPNVDAACRLAREIMPLVWQKDPGIVLTLAGADPVRAVRRLSGARVRVPGFIEDLEPVLTSHRVFAAPLRFGAGLKGKIVQAMAAGLPVVTTAVGGEGIATPDGEVIVADDAREFARALLRLYDDPVEWERYSERGLKAAAERFSPEAVARQLYSVLGTV